MTNRTAVIPRVRLALLTKTHFFLYISKVIARYLSEESLEEEQEQRPDQPRNTEKKLLKRVLIRQIVLLIKQRDPNAGKVHCLKFTTSGFTSGSCDGV